AQLHLPGARHSHNFQKIVVGWRLCPAMGLAGCRYTHDRNTRATHAVNTMNAGQMRVSVQDEFRPMLAHHILETSDPDQPLVRTGGATHWRVMDQDHAKQSLLACLL